MFGPCVQQGLTLVPRSLAVAPSRPQALPEIALLGADRHVVQIYSAASDGSPTLTDSVALSAPQQTIIAADIYGDGTNAYLTLAAESPAITIIRRAGTSFSTRVVPATRAQRMTVADITNDHRPDILLYGRTTAGVATLINKGNGVFERGPLLFPDISVSDLQITDLNGDGIADVFALDWLSNQLLVFYGITKTIFSEQLAVDIPGEPSELSLSPVSPLRTLEVAITLPTEKKIVVFKGNSLGDFTIHANIDCPVPPSGVLLVDLRGDQLNDLVSATTRGIMVAPRQTSSSFGPLQFFGVAGVTNAWAVAPWSSQKGPALIAADPATRILSIVENASPSSPGGPAGDYAVGMDPQGVALADLDNDGFPDIAVANNGSATLSLLWNEKGKGFTGQASVPVPDRPVQVEPIQGGTKRGLVVAHPQYDRVTIVSTSAPSAPPMVFSMPTGDHPALLGARISGQAQQLEIPVSSELPGRQAVSLAIFQQLSGHQFLEQSVTPTIQSPVLAVALEPLRDRDGYMLLFASGDKATRSTTVYKATTTASGFGTVTPVLRYADSTFGTRMLCWGQPSKEGVRKALFAIGEPQNMLGIFTVGDSLERRKITWIRDARPRNQASIVFRDMDGDGVDDIVFLDRAQQAVILYRGKDDGQFAPPAQVYEGKSLGGFAVGPLGSERVNDLVVSHQATGCVTIIRDPFRRTTP